MELAVWDYDRLGPSELLGSVVIGWNEKSNETTLSRVSAATHWQQMLENPRRPIVYWHQLKVKLQPALPVKTLCPFFVQCILLYSGFYSISCGFVSASSWHTVNSKHAALTLFGISWKPCIWSLILNVFNRSHLQRVSLELVVADYDRWSQSNINNLKVKSLQFTFVSFCFSTTLIFLFLAGLVVLTR